MSNRKKRAFFRKRGFAPQVSRATLSLEEREVMRHMHLLAAGKSAAMPTRTRPREGRTNSRFVVSKGLRHGLASATAVYDSVLRSEMLRGLANKLQAR